jgi:glutamine synthetase
MAERKKAASDPTKAFVQRLRKGGARFVRFELPDMHGMARAKVIPIDKVEGYARKGLNMYGGVLSLDTASMVVPASLYHEEVKYRDQKLFPDFESVRPVPWLPDTVRVVCDTVWEPGQPLGAAPRNIVRRLLDQAETMGFLAVMAHEFEYYVLDSEMKPLWEGLHIFNATRNEQFPLLRELLEHLMTSGLEIITHNCEYASSQYETNYGPAAGMRGADNGYIFKNVVKEVCMRAELNATFMSKPFLHGAGSGCHYHVSFLDKRTKRNVFLDKKDPDGISKTLKHFVRGILDHAPAMMALMAPTPNCYRRLRPHTFAPSNISWGIEDRTAAVRIKNSRDDATHIENRIPSALCNPYLSAAATLAAGLLGLKEKRKLPPQTSGPSEEDPSIEKLPTSLEAALDALQADKAFGEMLGEEFVQVYSALKRFELARFHEHITDWERDEYLVYH